MEIAGIKFVYVHTVGYGSVILCNSGCIFPHARECGAHIIAVSEISDVALSPS